MLLPQTMPGPAQSQDPYIDCPNVAQDKLSEEQHCWFGSVVFVAQDAPRPRHEAPPLLPELPPLPLLPPLPPLLLSLLRSWRG